MAEASLASRHPDGSGGRPLTIRHAAVLHPCERRDEEPLLDAWVRIEGNRIVDLGAEPCPLTADGPTIDASRKLVVPGLINLHHHFSQSITRAMPDGLSHHTLPWLQTMLPLWRELDEEATAAAVRLAAAELLTTGATTSVDMPYLFPGGQEGLLDVEVAAVREMGLRLHLVRGNATHLAPPLASYLEGLRGGAHPTLVESEVAILAATRSAIDAHHDPGRFSMCRVALGPLSVTYDRPDFLRALVRLSEEAGCGRHTHLTPREDEVALCQALHGCSPSSFLRDLGWFGAGSWVAHGSRLTPEDIAVLAQEGSGVSHCPNQNMRLGFPAGPVPELLAAGVKVGFGVDGCSSNDSGSMLGELRVAHMIHRLEGVHSGYGPDRWLTARDVLWMATRDAAAILGRDDIGRIAPGCAADFVLVNLDQLGFAGGLHDPLSTLLFAGDTAVVDMTIVNGRIVVEDGRLACVDQRAVVAAANRAAARLVEKAQRRTGLSWRSLAGRLAAP